MSPLSSLMILLYLLVIAIATVAWLTLTARERAERTREAREARDEAPSRRPRADLSNDVVRGAKAPRKHAPVDNGLLTPPSEAGVRVRPRRKSGDDPFDRFLDPERRRRDGGDR